MNLLKSIRSEIFKTKRTAAFYFTLVAAASTPVLLLLFVSLDGFEPEDKPDPFNQMFKRFEMTGLVIFPLFVVLVCTLLPQLEYRNNTWKQLFASPQTKANVFMAKFINIHLLILLFLSANLLFMFIAVIPIHFIHPELNVLNHPLDVQRVLVNYINAYISLLALVAIQYWLGLRFKNFIVPIAIGLALWISGILLVLEYKSPYGIYFPYSYQVYSNFDKYKPQLNQVAWYSLGYAILFMGIGFLEFRRMRLNA